MKSTLSKIINLILKYKINFVFIVLLSINIAISSIVSPLYIGNSIDNIHSYPLFIKNIFYLILLYFSYFISNILLSICITNLASNISKDLRTKLYSKLNNLKFKDIDNISYGEIVNTFSVDVNNISNGVIGSISKILIGISSIILAIILIFRINVIMSIILILSTPIMYCSSKFIVSRTKKLFQKRANTLSKISGLSEEMFSGVKTYKSYNYEDYSISKFAKTNNKLSIFWKNARFYSSLTNPVTRFVTNLAYISIGFFGCLLAKFGKVSIGNISSFLLYVDTFTKPFNEISSIISELQESLASADRIFNFLELDEEKNLYKKDIIQKEILGNIEFKNVDFSYDKSKTFIKNMNFTVSKGETIAIVGKTGSGKTTIVNLLMRFYDIDNGEILVDGININNYSKEFLRKNIGMVLQDTKLFTGTVKENIAYGKPNATMDEIINAAKLANADSFIRRLPNGYETILNNQTTLSSGEIQLLTIARIMLISPPILILDEATSNVDIITESKINKAFAKLQNNSTTFIIAHRLSTIKNADKILLIENGNILEQGTHEELLAKKGGYYNLYKEDNI